MAESTPSPSPEAKEETSSKTTEKVEKVTKVDKPDEEKYKKDLAEAEKQLSSIQEKMVSPPLKLVVQD